MKLPPSERPLSPTREELVLSTPSTYRRRGTPPAETRTLYVADPNEPPELAAIRRDRAVKAPLACMVLQQTRDRAAAAHPVAYMDIENEPSTFVRRPAEEEEEACQPVHEPVAEAK